MAVITIDNDALSKSSSLLTQLQAAKNADNLSNDSLRPFNSALTAEFGRMKDCQDNIETAEVQIAALKKALSGWTAFKAYQERRYPGLERRYKLARDYIRAAEDEQTGN